MASMPIDAGKKVQSPRGGQPAVFALVVGVAPHRLTAGAKRHTAHCFVLGLQTGLSGHCSLKRRFEWSPLHGSPLSAASHWMQRTINALPVWRPHKPHARSQQTQHRPRASVCPPHDGQGRVFAGAGAVRSSFVGLGDIAFLSPAAVLPAFSPARRACCDFCERDLARPYRGIFRDTRRGGIRVAGVVLWLSRRSFDPPSYAPRRHGSRLGRSSFRSVAAKPASSRLASAPIGA